MSAVPTGGPSAWTSASIDPDNGSNRLNAASCPSVSLCVAVDSAGNAVVGTSTPAPATLSRHRN